MGCAERLLVLAQSRNGADVPYLDLHVWCATGQWACQLGGQGIWLSLDEGLDIVPWVPHIDTAIVRIRMCVFSSQTAMRLMPTYTLRVSWKRNEGAESNNSTYNNTESAVSTTVAYILCIFTGRIVRPNCTSCCIISNSTYVYSR